METSERVGILLLFALNDFTNCFGGAQKPLPPPVTGLSFEIATAKRVHNATDVITGRALPLIAHGERVMVALPAVDDVVAAVVEFA